MTLNISKPLRLPLSKQDLDAINIHLSPMTPEEILAWALEYLPGLHQTTAFGLTGLVAIDMLSKLTPSPPPLIFLDTLYHFPETYELVEEVKSRYKVPVHVYKPDGCETVADFEAKYGENFWEKNEDSYDIAVKVCQPYELLNISLLTHLQQKVEPARRAYKELGVQSVITGRRASQGGDRATLQPLEVDSTGLLKLNPLLSWNFDFVKWYISKNKVPRNKLLDQGYRSVGDWHSTSTVGEGQGERAGRWPGREKMECGLHEDHDDLATKAPARPTAAGMSNEL